MRPLETPALISALLVREIERGAADWTQPEAVVMVEDVADGQVTVVVRRLASQQTTEGNFEIVLGMRGQVSGGKAPCRAEVGIRKPRFESRA